MNSTGWKKGSGRACIEAQEIPFIDILRFSIFSCMRIGEVCRLRWEDIDKKERAVLVRDRKDPGKRKEIHMRVALLGEAWDIVQRQPRTTDLIFPYKSASVTAGFQRVRNALDIQDLRYHDMRREGPAGYLRQDSALRMLLR
jgi:integrase